MSCRGSPVPLCKSAGTKELKVVHGASATCVLQNVDSLLSRLSNLKGSVGLILAKASAMRVTIPIDLSTRPLHRFLNSRRVSPLLNQSLVLIPQQSA